MSDRIVLPTHPLFNDLTGQRLGKLFVVSYAGRYGKNQISSWRCKCDCGKEKVIKATSLRSGVTSCGCLRLEKTIAVKTTHGMTGTVEYRAWSKIRDRCDNPSDKCYADYGGRGIRVCERWRESFENFLADMGPRPADKESIDRKDNAGNYEPGNCRWATRIEQNRNKRTNHYLEWNGQSRMISEWAEIMGIPPDIISTRLRRGWTVERTLGERPKMLKRCRYGTVEKLYTSQSERAEITLKVLDTQ